VQKGNHYFELITYLLSKQACRDKWKAAYIKFLKNKPKKKKIFLQTAVLSYPKIRKWSAAEKKKYFF